MNRYYTAIPRGGRGWGKTTNFSPMLNTLHSLGDLSQPIFRYGRKIASLEKKDLRLLRAEEIVKKRQTADLTKFQLFEKRSKERYKCYRENAKKLQGALVLLEDKVRLHSKIQDMHRKWKPGVQQKPKLLSALERQDSEKRGQLVTALSGLAAVGAIRAFDHWTLGIKHLHAAIDDLRSIEKYFGYERYVFEVEK